MPGRMKRPGVFQLVAEKGRGMLRPHKKRQVD